MAGHRTEKKKFKKAVKSSSNNISQVKKAIKSVFKGKRAKGAGKNWF